MMPRGGSIWASSGVVQLWSWSGVRHLAQRRIQVSAGGVTA
jgi:hypothetical protein